MKLKLNLKKQFDNLADSLFSLPPILVGFLAISLYLIFESQELISLLLPETMNEISKEIAAGFLALAIHLMILLTATNQRLVSHWFTKFYAVAAYCITALFFDAFDFAGKSDREIFAAHLFSVLIASINYLVVYLLVGKYNEVRGQADARDRVAYLSAEKDVLKSQVKELERSLKEGTNRVEQQTEKFMKMSVELEDYRKGFESMPEEKSLLQDEVRTYKEEYNKATAEINASKKRIHELLTEIRELDSWLLENKLKCPHCGELQRNANVYSAHSGRCEKNPKNIAKANGQAVKS